MATYRLSGRIVKVIRILNDDSTQEVAQRLGITRQSVLNAENGSTQFGEKTTQNFLRVYGLSRQDVEMLESIIIK